MKRIQAKKRLDPFHSRIDLSLGRKGGAVGTLTHCGITLVSYNLDLIKRAVVLSAAMILALSNGAANGLVCGIALGGAAGILCFVHNGIPF